MPEAIVPKKEQKPWKGICCSRCWFAKHEKCKCRCKKQNHGKAYEKKIDKPQFIDDGSLSLDGGKTTYNRADGKAPWEPYP